MRNGLTCDQVSVDCKDYDKSIDPSTFIEFAQSAFRMLHAKLPSTVQFVNASNFVVKEMTLSDMVGASQMLEKNYDDLLRGMLQQKIETERLGYSNEANTTFVKQILKRNLI